MKHFYCLIAGIFIILNISAQEHNDTNINVLTEKINNLEQKISELEKSSKSINYKLYKHKKESAITIKLLEDSLKRHNENYEFLSNEIEADKIAMKSIKNNLRTLNEDVTANLEKLKKNFRFDLIIEASILIFIILLISFLLFRFSRKNRHELVDLKREVDLEIKTIEKESISEIRALKEDMKKYKSPEVLKHGPAYETLRLEFLNEINDAKETLINRINELSEKYQKESSYTKEGFEKEVFDFKKQIQKEIDSLIAKIEKKD
jgi:hypothetical protein